MATDYSDLFTDTPQAPAANLNLRFGVEANPDQAAEAAKLARRYRLPVGVVSEFRDDYRQKAQVDDARQVVDQSPKLRDWLAADMNNASMAHDDVQTLGGIEQAVRTLKSVPSAIASGFPRMASGFYGFTAAPFEAAGQVFGGAEDWLASLMGAQGYKSDNAGRVIGGTLRGIAQDQQALTERVYTPPKDAGIIERGVGSGLQSAVQSVVSAPFALRQSGEQAALALMGATTFGSSYLKATDKGKTPLEAIPFASADAVAEVVTEKYFGFSGLMAQVRAGSSAAKMFVYEIVKETPGEIGATIWQNFNEWMSLNPDKSVSEWFAEQPEAIGETIVATLVGGGAQIGAIKGTQNVISRMSGEEGRAQQAEQHAAAIEQLGKLGAASKLNARDATTFKALVAQIADEEGDAPTQFFIDPATLANSLNQSGVTMAELEAMAPTVAKQLQSPTGGDIRVPVSEFMAAGEELTMPLIDHIRISEDAMTRAEAQEYLKTQGDTIKADVERELQGRDDQAQFRQSIDGVRTQFETELNTAKRFTPAVNKAYSELLANFYGATASRLGMTPEALLDKYKLRVQAQGVAGERTLNQVDTATPEFANWFGDSKVVDEAGKPRVVYHGTNDKFTKVNFKKGAQGLFWFTSDRASIESGDAGAQGSKNIMELFAKIENPAGWKEYDKYGVDELQRMGYDGVILPESDGSFTGFIFKDAAQVKSATKNRGTFDPNDANILNQSALPAAESTTDENGNPEINSADVRLMFAQPAERFEFIPDAGQQMYNMAIMSPAGDYLGYVELVYEGGKPTALYDIEVNKDTRMGGTGAKVIEAILAANPDQGILISNVVPAARGFWEKVGVPQQNVGEGDAYDGTLDWNTYAASPAGRKSLQAGRDAGAGGSNPGRAEGGGTGPVSGVLDQGQDGVTPRAQIAFPGDLTAAPSVISLLAGADLSSFLHESGHLFLEIQSDLATRIQQQIDSGASVKPAERGIVDDMNRLLEWFGVKGNENQTALTEWAMMTLEQKREHHETFARGFENFAYEGKAPSLDLQPIFSRFRSWLGKVYDLLLKASRGDFGAALKVKLNDDVRAVMSRMLATDFAIEEAEAARNMGPLFKTAADGAKYGMTLEQYNALHALGEDAKAAAVAQLDARMLKDMKWMSRARDKALKARQQEVDELRREIKNEVRSEVMAEPVYQAWQFLTSKSEDAAEAGKLRTEELRDMYGTAEDAPWRKLSALRMTSDTVGLSPEVVADRLGFDSGDALVKTLADAMPPQEVIDARTDQRMLEMFGDITSEEALQRAADEAVHNEARARFIATEMKALESANKVTERQGKTTVNVLARAAKDYAQQIIARLKVREIRPNQYAVAEARNAKLAEKAFMAGKTEEAAMHKRNQLVNNYATRAAYDAQEEVKAAQKYFRKFDKRSKSIDAGYLDQIEQMLERFDFRQASLKEIDRRKAFSEWYQEQQSEGIVPDVPAALLNDANRKSYRDMTLEELRGLRETVEQIEHIGRLKNRLLLAKDKRDFDAIRADIITAITESKKGKRREYQLETKPVTIGDRLTGYLAEHRKLSSFLRQIDMADDNGIMYTTVGRAMNTQDAWEGAKNEEYTRKFLALLAPLEKMRGGLTGKASMVYLKGINKSMTRAGRLSVVLNYGNKDGRARLMSGKLMEGKEDWTDAQIQEVMSSLSPAELEFANKAWPLLNELWPDVVAKIERLSGVPPPKVEAEPFDVRASDGTVVRMNGGYYPLRYDSSESPSINAKTGEQAAKDMLQAAATRSMTRHGHENERLQGVKHKLRLDLNVMTDHMQEVIHDLAWHEFLIDTNKIFRDKEIAQALNDYYGPDTVGTIKRTLEAIAGGDRLARDQTGALALQLRSNVSRAVMAWSATTAFLQPFGIFNSMARVGVVPMLQGVQAWAGTPSHMVRAVKEIQAKSSMMRNRALTQNRELYEIAKIVKGRPKAMRLADASMFFFTTKMQQVVDVPTWLGAYNKSLTSHPGDEQLAIDQADRAVIESQGSGSTKDLAQVQRDHPFMTQFMSYFSATYQGMAEKTQLTDFKNPVAVAGWAADMALYAVLPAILPSLLMYLLKGGGDDDEPGDWAKKLAKWQAQYLLAPFVYARELGGIIEGFDYAGPPAARIFTDTKKLYDQAAQGEVDEPLVLASVRVLGDLTGLPTTQIIRSYKGWKAWEEGQDGAGPQSVLFGPPPKK